MYNTFLYITFKTIVYGGEKKAQRLLEGWWFFSGVIIIISTGKFQSIYSKRARNTLKQKRTNIYFHVKQRSTNTLNCNNAKRHKQL